VLLLLQVSVAPLRSDCFGVCGNALCPEVPVKRTIENQLVIGAMQYRRDRSTTRAEDWDYPVMLCTSIPLCRM